VGKSTLIINILEGNRIAVKKSSEKPKNLSSYTEKLSVPISYVITIFAKKYLNYYRINAVLIINNAETGSAESRALIVNIRAGSVTN
jgi:hypothetical protein